MYKFRLR